MNSESSQQGRERYLVACVNRRLGPNKPSCAAAGAEVLIEKLERALLEAGLSVLIERRYCLGRCDQGPVIRIAGGPFFAPFSEQNIPDLIYHLKTLPAPFDDEKIDKNQ